MAQEFTIDEVREVLRRCPEYEEGHHLGRPFMSAYQLAIRFAERFPHHPLVEQLSVGGAGTGMHQSLAQRLARFLSSSLKGDTQIGIEGGFISHDRVEELYFKGLDGRDIRVSTLSSEHGHAIFRYVEI